MFPPAPHRFPALAALLLAAAPALVGGCGKKGPPLPPLRIRPAAAREVSLRQIGPDIVVTAVLPEARTDGTPLEGGLEVRLLRMPAGPGFRPGAVSGRFLLRQFEKEAKAVARLSGDSLRAAAQGRRLRHRDAGAAAAAVSGGPPRYLYSVLVIDGQGRRSDLTPPAAIEAVEPPPVPRHLTAETAEGEVRLDWEAPDARVGRIYNVYRRAASDPDEPDGPLNPEPFPGTSYVDGAFRYGETYRYTVRTVAAGGRPLRESASAAEIEVRPVDSYPPKAPGGLAAAAEGAVVKVYWFPNSEPDLAGYRIYRRSSADGPFEQVGQVGAVETSFVDSRVVPGVRYYYVVTAIDATTPPNESPRSEERSEAVPPGPAPREPPGPVPVDAPPSAPGRPR